ncbi:hypothetical protein [Halobacillus kuroshimensis]|uniref:hypothetical protein n=1 Tax=Halobacillus kuroshimensis TaxID=302481 RepID=UPI00048833AC|nr:hypothetical protein [Halobacillus kuroshimensis]
MALLPAKAVVAGVIGAAAITGGVVFTGGDTVDTVKQQLEDFKNKIVQYEANEGSLLDKIGLIKKDASAKLTDANAKIVDAKSQVKDLEAERSFLQKQIDKLNGEVTQLKSDKEQLGADLEETKAALAAKEQELESTKVTLANVEQALADKTNELNELQDDYDKLQTEYDQLEETSGAQSAEIERLEGEVVAANDKVAELGEVSDQVNEETADAEPLTADELDGIGVENEPDVYDAELVVQKLNLTYIQDGQSEEFKDAHPDLDIKEGDRVWRITNNNEFKVYVEYRMANGSVSSEIIANPSQTFFMSGNGGTMVIKWQDEHGQWQQTTKAGA